MREREGRERKERSERLRVLFRVSVLFSFSPCPLPRHFFRPIFTRASVARAHIEISGGESENQRGVSCFFFFHVNAKKNEKNIFFIFERFWIDRPKHKSSIHGLVRRVWRQEEAERVRRRRLRRYHPAPVPSTRTY